MLETHSLILKASSPFFRVVLGKWRTSANNNPTIIYMPGFSHEQLVLVVEFIYQGRTTVADNLLHVFVATANSLGMFLKPTTVPVPGTFEKTTKDQMVDDVDATEGQEISQESKSHGNITDKMSVRTENIKKPIDNKLRIEISTGDVDNYIDVGEHFEIAKHVATNPNNQIEVESEKVETTNNYNCEQGDIVKHMKDDQEIHEPGEIRQVQGQEVEPVGKSMDTRAGMEVHHTPRKSEPSAGSDNLENIRQKRKYKKRKQDFGVDDISQSKKVSTRGKIK